MPEFPDLILQTIQRYQMLGAGDRVGVAVSGGVDSVCLFHVLLELRSQLDLKLSVIHVNHHLRGAESQEDERFVGEMAERFGLTLHSRDLDLQSAHGNLEQEARRGRYAFFHELLKGQVNKVALGHTRSDQAETVLFRLLRGAGSAGLAGIRPVTNWGLVRPLIRATRSDVERWLHARGTEWREDSSNQDPRFDRNRLRHGLLPQLESDWNPNLKETLANTADWAFEEERYWAEEIDGLAASDWVRFEKAAATVHCANLCSLPVAVTRRLIRRIVERVKGDLLGVDFSHIEEVRALAGPGLGSGRVEIPGLEMVRSFDWVRFAECDDLAWRDWEIPARVPGSYVVAPEVIDLEPGSESSVYNRDGSVLDSGKVGSALVLRNWRPGDQYRRLGHSAPEKLKDLFQKYRIPLWERRNWPVITQGDNLIVWVRKFGAAAQFAADAGSRTVVIIRETPI
jgi:tRNA(Ile)-lysidine synthase